MISRRGFIEAAALSIALFALTGLAHDQIIAGPAKVIDGDTIKIAGRSIRLSGIDAPEIGQTCFKDDVEWTCGPMAAVGLQSLIDGQEVRCEVSGRDRYRRLLAVCEAEGRGNLNEMMVRIGWALNYRGPYAEQEQQARKERIGLWVGRFTPPWKWREKPI